MFTSPVPPLKQMAGIIKKNIETSNIPACKMSLFLIFSSLLRKDSQKRSAHATSCHTTSDLPPVFVPLFELEFHQILLPNGLNRVVV
jgi:hypothetical protein